MTQTAFQVRPARQDDASGIADVYNHYVERGEATFDTRCWSVSQVADFLAKPAPDGWCVASCDQQIVGWASVKAYNKRSGYRFTCETSIYLLPQAQGIGISAALQQWVEEHCQRCGIHHAVARVIADNEASMAFHLRHGYTLVGIQKEVGHMNGQWVDVALLQRLFPTTL